MSARRLAATLALAMLCGCFRARRPIEKICAPEPDAGKLCLLRASPAARLVPVGVFVDGRKVLDAANDEFSEVVLSPGDHVLRVSADGYEGPPPEDFSVRVGDVSAFEIELVSYGGAPAIIDLQRHEPSKARAYIHERRLAASSDVPFDVPK